MLKNEVVKTHQSPQAVELEAVEGERAIQSISDEIEALNAESLALTRDRDVLGIQREAVEERHKGLVSDRKELKRQQDAP